MAANVGRNVKIRRDGTLIAGARTKNININKEPIDVTTDDDDGFRRVMEASATKSIDLSVEGLTQDDTLIAQAANGGTLIEEYEIEFSSGATITGDFRLNSLEIGAEYNEAVTFSTELQSTGEWAYAAAQ